MLMAICIGMQGWAGSCDFNFSDVRSGADVVVANCGTSQPDWKKLRGLLENAIYGGRVDNARDVQVCPLEPLPPCKTHQQWVMGAVSPARPSSLHM